jgi:hypothetical protein
METSVSKIWSRKTHDTYQNSAGLCLIVLKTIVRLILDLAQILASNMIYLALAEQRNFTISRVTKILQLHFINTTFH